MTKTAKKRVRSYERTADQAVAITPIEYSELQEAFDHFNRALFAGELPDVFMTYQRKANSHGYFAADRFTARNGQFRKHELALNPDAFIGQGDEQVCQTLVHEMTHLWQHAFGKLSARNYHNTEWAAKMKAVGLMPSSTGMVGGKETGQRIMEYIIPDGLFSTAFAELALSGSPRGSPVSVSHSRTVLSSDAVTMRLPSGLNAALHRLCVWPRSGWPICLPVRGNRQANRPAA